MAKRGKKLGFWGILGSVLAGIACVGILSFAGVGIYHTVKYAQDKASQGETQKPDDTKQDDKDVSATSIVAIDAETGAMHLA